MYLIYESIFYMVMKINIVVLVCLLVCSLPVGAQIGNIKTKHTKKHISVSTTRLSIVPPKNFSKAKNFVGFENAQAQAITIIDLVGGNFESNARNVQKEHFINRGINLIEFEEFKINDFPAKYAFVEIVPFDKRMMVVFGDSTFSCMVIVTFASATEKQEKEFKKALQTIFYDKSQRIDYLATAPFELGEHNFTFETQSGGMYLFKPAKADKDTTKRDMLMIASLPTEEKSPQLMLDGYLIGLMAKGFHNTERKNGQFLKVNNLDAYEEVVEGYFEGTTNKAMLYFYITIEQNRSLLVQAFCNSENKEESLREFRKFAQKLQFKR